jgi:hypothetical protein
MRLSHVFVTHTHMDHFSGFDHLLRVVLGRKAGVVLFGGPDFAAQVEHKLNAYTWNVVHRYEVELVIDVREIGMDGRGRRARFSSRTRFARESCASFELLDDVLHEETAFRVRGRFVDHDIPCLAYAIEEKARVKVGKDRLAALGLSTGSWLRELKHAVLTGAPGETPVQVQWRDRHGEHAVTRQVSELRQLVLDIVLASVSATLRPPLHRVERRDAVATAGRRGPAVHRKRVPGRGRGACGAQESSDGAPGRSDRAPDRGQGRRAVPLFATLRRTLGGADR